MKHSTTKPTKDEAMSKADKWYWMRVVLACTVIGPLWIVEKVVHAIAGASDWLMWKWNNARWLWWLNEKMSDFVGGPTRTRGPKP